LQEGKTAESIDLLREGLALQARVPKEKPSLSLAILNTLAHALQQASRPEEARETIESLVGRCRALFGEDDYRTLGSESGLAMVLAALGRVDDAAESLAKTLERARKAPGPGSFALLAALENLAALRGGQGRAADAADLARERVEVCAAA